MIYLFDGSLEGLLCAVFEWFERKPGKVSLINVQIYQPDAFNTSFEVKNDTVKADRVWKGLQKRLDKSWMRKLYCCYLSELPEAHTAFFEFVCQLFASSDAIENNYGNEHVLFVAQTARKVEREKHRMEAFIRFKHTSDGMYYCGIEPDFNILPLIMKHFKDRYADQIWVIYDLKRGYGLYYDLEKTAQIYMDIPPPGNLNNVAETVKSENETLYAQLWADYFKSTNIAARKNTKLHARHVPKRYWKYLTEKELSLQ